MCEVCDLVDYGRLKVLLLMPTVAIWVQLKSNLCQTKLAIICDFGHLGTLILSAER